ncbi:MAG: hypothetical protein IKP60_06385 [Treponema sp.]|nr:hypothetical protein [Treponema sp.]
MKYYSIKLLLLLGVTCAWVPMVKCNKRENKLNVLYERLLNLSRMGFHPYQDIYPLEIHPADLFLRNASQTREDMRKFFDEELSVKMKEMVEKKFPAVQKDEYLA